MRNSESKPYDELIDCVETNDKQRFAFDETGDRIRANQGHSVEVDLQLEEREPPEFLYHGTVERFLPSILKEGLVYLLTKLDLNSRCVFCKPLPHLVVRPRPLHGAGITMIVFWP